MSNNDTNVHQSVPSAIYSWIKEQVASDENFLLLFRYQHRFGNTSYDVVKIKDYSPKSAKHLTCVFTSYSELYNIANYVYFPVSQYTLPTYQPVGQKWMAYLVEAPANNMHPIPSWLPHNINQFHWLISYHENTDIYAPYGKCWPKAKSLSVSEERSLTAQLKSAIGKKTRLVAWIVSHCDVQSAREWYVRELKLYVDVDVFGDCAIKCLRKGDFCFQYISKTYKFVLALENSLCEGYISEKPFHFLTPTLFAVPIVLGMANYSRILPPHSFIDVSNFSSPEALAQYLTYLDRNDEEYKKYFAWRRKYECDNKGHYLQSFCKQLHALKDKKQSLSLETVKRNLHPKNACIRPRKFYDGIVNRSRLLAWPDTVLDKINLFGASPDI